MAFRLNQIFLSTAILLSFTLSKTVFSQHRNLLLNYEVQNTYDRLFLDSNSTSHTSLRPYNTNFINNDLYHAHYDSTKVYTLFHLKFLKEHLVEIEDKDFNIYIDPLFAFELGLDFLDTSGRGSYQDDGGTFYINTRGFLVQGDLGDKFSFSTSFFENQSYFPDYLRLYNWSKREYIHTNNGYNNNIGQSIVPGQGRAKTFKTTGFDYAYAEGYVSYSPLKNINLQFGHGRHFIGNGYRSLLLSDASFNYPYWSIRSSWFDGKLQHNFIYAYMSNLFRLPEHSAPEASYIRKNGSFNYTSFKPNNRLEIGLFEGIIWNVYDSTLGSQTVSPLSYNPIPLVGTLINGLNDAENNAVIGLTASYKIKDKILLYGQLAIDDLSNNRFGYQAGVKLLDVIPRLTVTSEINTVAKYTYAHASVWRNYSHYNESIAHPYGAGFTEWVSYLRYELKNRFWVNYKLNLAVRTGDWSNKNNGGNIFYNYDPTFTPTDDRNTLYWQQFRIGYKANVKTNMNIFMGFNLRQNIADRRDNSMYSFIGISTDINNKYYDL